MTDITNAVEDISVLEESISASDERERERYILKAGKMPLHVKCSHWAEFTVQRTLTATDLLVLPHCCEINIQN